MSTLATSIPTKQRNTSNSGGIRKEYRPGWINAASTYGQALPPNVEIPLRRLAMDQRQRYRL
jgi:hypothetical protein